MITLFTFNRKVWRVKPLDAIRRYGIPDDNGRLGLYFTMSRTPNSVGLYIVVDQHSIYLRHTDGELLAQWDLASLVDRFMKKLPTLLFVSAFSEIRGDREWFAFDRAQLLQSTTKEIIRGQMTSGNILVDLRLHDKITSARNHGTGFRANEGKLPLLYSSVRDL